MPPVTSHQPRCAACIQPITKDEQFVLSGTEVFHLACVKARGTLTSVGNRRKAALASLTARARELEANISEFSARLDAAQREHDRMVKAEREVARLETQLAQTRERELEYRRQRDHAHHDRDQMNADRLDALAARDSARRELALIQHLAQQATAPLQLPDDPVKREDGKDATEQRFSLLELD